jgi:hypothetical protein
LSFTAAALTPSKSGTYGQHFSSTNGVNVYATSIEYNSYWQFGFLPNITNQPSGVSTNVGSNAVFNFTLKASSFPNILTYKNVTNLVSVQSFPSYNPATSNLTTNITVTLTNVSLTDAGSYTFVVTNFWGATTSAPVSLNVINPLAVSNPTGVTNYSGKNVSLSVTGTGSSLAYQWQKGSVNLVNGGTLSGVNTNVLNITPAVVSDSGNYSVIVSNSSGSVTSSIAAVSIVAIPVVTPPVLTTTNFTIGSIGLAGSQYVIQYSTNASGGLWIGLITNTTPGNGVISFTDTNNPATAQGRFYRVQFP